MDYDLLIKQLESLSEGVETRVTVLSNAAALLYGSLPRINWAGFYLSRGGTLVLGPFMGRPACVKIPYGRGVCGTAAQKDETQIVPDVHLFAGHIACDSASNAEIVVPLHGADGQVFGVLDIDSPVKMRFTELDGAGLERFARALERCLARCADCTV